MQSQISLFKSSKFALFYQNLPFINHNFHRSRIYIISDLESGITTVLYRTSYVADCSGSILGSAYFYSPPTPSLLGTNISVKCALGYDWSITPSGGSLTANCTNGPGGGTWQVVNGATCICELYILVYCTCILYSITCKLQLISHQYTRKLYLLSIVLHFFRLINTPVSCSNSTMSPGYSYTKPSPATLGSTMAVSCAPGYQWGHAPVNSSLNATCSSVNGVGTWVVNGADWCRGKYLFGLVFTLFTPLKTQNIKSSMINVVLIAVSSISTQASTIATTKAIPEVAQSTFC